MSEDLRGRCYELAFHYMMENPGTVLVHAVVTGRGPIEGLRYGHAWVEYEREGLRCALDIRTGVELPAKEIRRFGEADPVVEYTREQAMARVRETATYGPWDPRIQAAHHLDEEG